MLSVRSGGTALIGFMVVVAVGSIDAWATMDNLKSFKQAYPGKDAKAYSCKVCHQGALGKTTDLNAYGLELQKLQVPANSKKLTVDDYKVAEAGDADADGASNGAELQAGTSPADPASTPAVGP
jgi:hypothetical protein